MSQALPPAGAGRQRVPGRAEKLAGRPGSFAASFSLPHEGSHRGLLAPSSLRRGGSEPRGKRPAREVDATETGKSRAQAASTPAPGPDWRRRDPRHCPSAAASARRGGGAGAPALASRSRGTRAELPATPRGGSCTAAAPQVPHCPVGPSQRAGGGGQRLLGRG